MKRKLDTMKFDKEDEWEKHVDTSHQLVYKLASYDKPVSAKSNFSKLRRTLSQVFAPDFMVAESIGVPFEKVMESVQVAISRHKIQGTSKTVSLMAALASTDPRRTKVMTDDPIDKKRRDS